MPSYATLQTCRSWLMTSANPNNDDAVLAGLIEAASKRIDNYCGTWFGETKASYAFTCQLGTRYLRLYATGRPLIAITTLTNGDGTTIPGAGCTLQPLYQYPKTDLELSIDYYWFQAPGAVVYEDPDCVRVRALSYTVTGADYLPSYPAYGKGAWLKDGVKIAGLWGHHSDYANAWEDTGLTLSGAHTASTKTLTASGAIGLAWDVGDVLKIVDGATTEYVLVTYAGTTSLATGITGATCGIRRGYNGSTGVALSNGALIYRWRAEPTIVQATQMLVASLYASRNNPGGDRLVVEGIGAIAIPSGMPVKVKDELEAYVNPFTGRR